MRPTVSIVTPWKDQLGFLPAYLEAVKGADEVIVVDGGCTPESKRVLMSVFGSVLHMPGEFSFSKACNKGISVASGDIVIMLNNDVRRTGNWLDLVRAQVKRGALYGPELLRVTIAAAGVSAPYISAWCLAARRDVWAGLAGFDWETFTGGYWEDNDLCFRAVMADLSLVRVDWPILHLGNGTSGLNGRQTPQTLANMAAFEKRVCEAVYPPTGEGAAA